MYVYKFLDTSMIFLLEVWRSYHMGVGGTGR